MCGWGAGLFFVRMPFSSRLGLASDQGCDGAAAVIGGARGVWVKLRHPPTHPRASLLPSCIESGGGPPPFLAREAAAAWGAVWGSMCPLDRFGVGGADRVGRAWGRPTGVRRRARRSIDRPIDRLIDRAAAAGWLGSRVWGGAV